MATTGGSAFLLRSAMRKSWEVLGELHIHHPGGAVAHVPAVSTACTDRSAPFLLNCAVTRAAFSSQRFRARRTCAEPAFPARLTDMTNTQALPAQVQTPASCEQYSLFG
jgi:hypothetical protein